MVIEIGPSRVTAGPQRPPREVVATQVARYRATLGVIDEAQQRGVLLAQEDAAALVDRAVATYLAVLAGGPR